MASAPFQKGCDRDTQLNSIYLGYNFSKTMTLFAMCVNIIANPDVIEMYKSQMSLIPVSVKTVLLEILCKRGLIKDVNIFKQLVNSKVININLSECVVTDDILSCLVVCKYLQKLDLRLSRRQNRYITEKALISLFKNLSHLKVLAVPHCKEVSDEVMKTVCENCTKLNELYIPNSSITDISLLYISQNLYLLSVLNVLGTQISDVGIQYLASGPLSKTLSEINIDKCCNVSPHSSAIIAEKCPNIKIFSCGYCGNGEELFPVTNGMRTPAKQVFWSI